MRGATTRARSSAVEQDVQVAPLPDRWDVETDIAIVGGGACGMIAGLRAAEAGAAVVILERDASPSGSTALSSGFIPAAGTRAQRALGIDDSEALFAADIQAKAGGSAHPGITATATAAVAPALDWLEARHGFDWLVLDDFLYPGHRRHRMHTVPEKTGAALVARLMTAIDALDVPLVTGARVTRLHAAGGRVRGVTTARPDGREETIAAKAVILACNGYGGNPRLVDEHIPEIADALYFGHAGNTGDAVLWANGVGAATRDMSGYQGHGSVIHPHGILCTWALMMEGGIQVNSAGQRFSIRSPRKPFLRIELQDQCSQVSISNRLLPK
ncbi:MAG: FAD-dependent oxidoreductase, partial [Pseudomonadota bacterium]